MLLFITLRSMKDINDKQLQFSDIKRSHLFLGFHLFAVLNNCIFLFTSENRHRTNQNFSFTSPHISGPANHIKFQKKGSTDLQKIICQDSNQRTRLNFYLVVRSSPRRSNKTFLIFKLSIHEASLSQKNPIYYSETASK